MGFVRPTRSTEGREYFKLRDFTGELAIFKVNNADAEYVNPRFSKDEGRPYIWADVTIVTGEGAGKLFPNAEMSGQHVYEALVDAAGSDQPVLGRIIRGQIGGRPFFINDPEDGDEELAEELLESGDVYVVEADADEDGEDDLPY